MEQVLIELEDDYNEAKRKYYNTREAYYEGRMDTLAEIIDKLKEPEKKDSMENDAVPWASDMSVGL